MNLIADIGNSSTKLALYENGKKLSITRVDELSLQEADRICAGFRINRAIVSSVNILPDQLLEYLAARVEYVHLLSYKSELPFSIDYETPETLGTDRIAAMAGAYSQFSEKPLLVIDAGTAITYDLLSEGIYRGGNISPGLNTRFRALKEFTGRLPLIVPADKFTNPGKNTRDAILAGVITGVLYEINEYIRTFEKKYRNLKVIITGGDSEFLNGKIDYQPLYMPDLVIDGLNFILDYNAV
jgi:type III pantothenate kinase